MAAMILVAALVVILTPMALVFRGFIRSHPRVKQWLVDLLGLLAIPPLLVVALLPLAHQGAGSDEWLLLLKVFLLGAKPVLLVVAGLIPLVLGYRMLRRA